MTTEGESTPLTLGLAAALVALLAVQQLWMRGIPAFQAGDPGALSELLDVVIYFLVAGGLASCQRWAWWIAVIGAAVSSAIPVALLGGWEALELAREFDDPAWMVQALTIIGTVAFVLLVLLLTPSARAAVRR